MAEKTNIDRVLGSEYDISQEFIELANHFFQVPPDTIKTGMFGYTTEITAHATKKNIFNASFLHNEAFFNTASLPSSIYKHAGLYGAEIRVAKPSSATIVIGLRYKDIYRNTNYSPVAGTDVFRLDRDQCNFKMGDFNFKLPFSIHVKLEKNLAVATYDITETDIDVMNPHIYRSNPYVRTMSSDINVGSNETDRFVFFVVDVFQVDIYESIIDIRSDDLSQRVFHEVDLGGQSAGFSVDYILRDTVTPLPKFLNNSGTPLGVDQYVYYGFTDNNQVQLFFPTSEGKFRPEMGSQLRVKSYVTRGSEGNFKYQGQVLFTFEDNPQYDNFITTARVTSFHPSGGRNAPTIAEVKQDVFRVIRHRNMISSDSDLNEFFKTISRSNSKIRFIKRQDDLIKREFVGYVLAEDDEGDPIPTNTVDFNTTIDQIEYRGNTVPAGSLIIYDALTSSYRLVRYDEYPDQYIQDPNIYVYALPFTAHVKYDPFPRLAFFDTSINVDVGTRHDHINLEALTQFATTNINYYRNPLLSDKIFINTTVSIDSGDSSIVENYRLMAVITDEDDISLGYFEMKYNEDTGQYEAELDMKDEFGVTNKLPIMNSIYALGAGSPTVIEEVLIPSVVNVKFCLLRENNSYVNIPGHQFSLMDEFSTIPEIRQQWEPIGYFSNTEKVNFYKSMDDVIRCTMEVNEDSGVVDFFEVPLVSSHIFFDVNEHTKFMDIYNDYVLTLRSNFDKLVNNTSINMKLYNSYGISKAYSIYSTDISLDLRIKLRTEYNQNLEKKIRRATIDYIKSLNTNRPDHFATTNITTHLEQMFSEIDYVRVTKMSNQPVNEVNRILDEEQEMLVGNIIAPEFLTIRRRSDISQGKHDLNITFIQ